MSAIGFDLYVKLLANAVERYRSLMRGETPAPESEGPEVTIDLPISAHLPASYVPDLNTRLALYQRLSAAADPEAVADIGREMVDRLGEAPPVARNLMYVVVLRAMARLIGVQSITTEDGAAVIRMREGEALPLDVLEGAVPRGVQLTRHSLRVELTEGWQERLTRSLEQVADAKAAEEPVAAGSAG
jgi:transcription-repair coupling factor (superfamily II helicase)